MPVATTKMAKSSARPKVKEVPQPFQLDSSSVLARECTPHPISEWFNTTCKTTLHTSLHPFSLDQDGHHHAHGPDCCICQDTSLDCLLYLSLPCCNWSVGDLCLLNWFLGCSSTAAGDRHPPITNTTCPACRTPLFSKPVLIHPDRSETGNELVAAMALSSDILTGPAPAPARSNNVPLQQLAALPRRRRKWWHFGRASKTDANAHASSLSRRSGGGGGGDRIVFNSCPPLLQVTGSTTAQRARSSSDSLDMDVPLAPSESGVGDFETVYLTSRGSVLTDGSAAHRS